MWSLLLRIWSLENILRWDCVFLNASLALVRHLTIEKLEYSNDITRSVARIFVSILNLESLH